MFSARRECSREQALHEIEGILLGALRRVVEARGLHATDVLVLSRAHEVCDEGGVRFSYDRPLVRSNAGTRGSMAQLAQLWVLLAAVHHGLACGRKTTLRELWYRLKTSRLFSSPAQVSAKLHEVCAAVSCRAALPCPREALGVIAAPRGNMTGCVVLLQPGAPPLSLRQSTFEIPGDPHAIRAIRFDEARSHARCVLVVEKDSCFRRLIDEGFTATHYPCVLLTACGFPDLASRAMVRHVVEQLDLPAYAITDYNPHGMALMLCFKHGSAALGLEQHCCPRLQWLGLHAMDVHHPTPLCGKEVELPAAAFQPFGARDSAVMAGLLRRACVRSDPRLWPEAVAMHEAGIKVELEELLSFGFEYLARLVLHKILHYTSVPSPSRPEERRAEERSEPTRPATEETVEVDLFAE
ncbi:hypothetical protein AB1Y20_014824 [Prymnesium parvum]|uniref:DNA topoisomerase (ATP-hydrolyzing) n=1 Tax=Prymnesium parvum TaxID=97485 RepID=A0AB34JW12_PRYPA